MNSTPKLFILFFVFRFPVLRSFNGFFPSAVIVISKCFIHLRSEDLVRLADFLDI